jgi:hypothetical protein
LRRPFEAIRIGLAAGLCLGASRVGEGREAFAEAGIGRRGPMGLERLTPALLSVSKQRLRALPGRLRHVLDHRSQGVTECSARPNMN